MRILKNKCHSKIILGHASCPLLSESTFPMKVLLLLNNFSSRQWLLFNLIKTRGKYKEAIKFEIQLITNS